MLWKCGRLTCEQELISLIQSTFVARVCSPYHSLALNLVHQELLTIFFLNVMVMFLVFFKPSNINFQQPLYPGQGQIRYRAYPGNTWFKQE